jgi:hypothetical protein
MTVSISHAPLAPNFQVPTLTTVPVILITRHLRRLGVPKAHALSPRSLEILRQVGIPVSAIRRLPAHRPDAMFVRFVTNLSGQQVGCLPYERMSLDVLEHSPEVRWVYQLFGMIFVLHFQALFFFAEFLVLGRFG